MRIGVSGTHGTGKTTLAEELCAQLPGHVAIDEPYVLLEEEGYEFAFPPAPEDYRAQLARSVHLLRSPGPDVIFDRTPADFLAYLSAHGAGLSAHGAGLSAHGAGLSAHGAGLSAHGAALDVDAAAVRSAMATLDLLVLTPITAETARVLPGADLPELRQAVNDALLDLVYGDPLDAWPGLAVLELDGPLDRRCTAVLAALPRHPRG